MRSPALQTPFRLKLFFKGSRLRAGTTTLLPEAALGRRRRRAPQRHPAGMARCAPSCPRPPGSPRCPGSRLGSLPARLTWSEIGRRPSALRETPRGPPKSPEAAPGGCDLGPSCRPPPRGKSAPPLSAPGRRPLPARAYLLTRAARSSTTKMAAGGGPSGARELGRPGGRGSSQSNGRWRAGLLDGLLPAPAPGSPRGACIAPAGPRNWWWKLVPSST